MDSFSRPPANRPTVSEPSSTFVVPSSSLAESGLCPDWILASGSNACVAVNKAWFTSYTPFTTQLISSVSKTNHPMEVLGIGSVRLQTLTHKSNDSEEFRGSIILHNVLHAPDVICNILGFPFMADTEVDINWGREMTVGKDKDGHIICLFEVHPKPSVGSEYAGLPRLKIYHAPDMIFAKSKMKIDTAYYVNVHWPEAEQERYKVFCSSTTAASRSVEDSEPIRTAIPTIVQLTAPLGAELSGRNNDNNQDADDDDDDDDDEQEWDPTGHQADYAFEHKELEFIEKHWRTSEHFLTVYGLKFYDDQDLEEGKAIVQALMAGDE